MKNLSATDTAHATPASRRMHPPWPRNPRLWAFATLLLLAACGRHALSDRIGEQARTSDRVDLAKAADFAWTQVRIYTPYSTRQAICKDLGDLAPDCAREAPDSVPEAEFLLVFIDEGKSVRYEPHPRSNGNFLRTTGVLALQRQAAVFDVVPGESSHQANAIYLRPRVPTPP